MILNEVFDEEIPDETEEDLDAMMQSGTPVEIVTEKPEGDFKHVIGGRDIWFNAPLAGQFHAWKRYRASLETRYAVIRVKAKKSPSLEVLRELADMSEKFDLATLEFVESLIVNPDDVDFLQFEMISGRATMNDMYRILFGDPGPEDDQAPAPKPRKPAKKVANAKRARK